MTGRDERDELGLPPTGITLMNVSQDETFAYSLPMIKGYVTGNPPDGGTVLLKRLGAEGHPERVTCWPVKNGNFKCLADLDPGINRFILEFDGSRLDLNLEFRPKTIEHHVLPVYIICDGDDGRFQAPDSEDDSPESACRRISLGSRLIQSLTAEKLYERDMSKSTFRLARDADPDMDCIVFYSKLKAQQVYDMEPEQIWEHFGRELMTSRYGSDRRKYLAFLSCTRYSSENEEPATHEEVIARARGHVALGGGGLAVFGTGCLHTWPETIQEIVTRFADDTRVNKHRFMDDSCYRGTYGGCFSTTLGAVCHELGHAFDLGHSRRGIMGRGFDNVDLVFTISNRSGDANKNFISRNEAQHATVTFTRDITVTCTLSSPLRRLKGCPAKEHRSKARPGTESGCNLALPQAKNCRERKKYFASTIPADDLTFWERSCAVLLKYHRWFADEEVPNYVTSCIAYDRDRNIVHSSSGIRVIELRGGDGMVLHSWEFISGYVPKRFELPLRAINVNDVTMVVAEDSSGNLAKEYLTRR